MKDVTAAACLVAGTLWIAVAAAQTPPSASTPPSKPLSTSLGLVVFPAKGQDSSKQAADEGECFAWSKGQTGVDPFGPMAAPAAVPAQEETSSKQGGERLRGAARGAAAGAVIGEVADDDAGKGAAIGATAGVLKGGRDSRKSKKESEQQAASQAEQNAESQQAAHAEQVALFNKGFAACLEPRGYTVK